MLALDEATSRGPEQRAGGDGRHRPYPLTRLIICPPAGDGAGAQRVNLQIVPTPSGGQVIELARAVPPHGGGKRLFPKIQRDRMYSAKAPSVARSNPDSAIIPKALNLGLLCQFAALPSQMQTPLPSFVQLAMSAQQLGQLKLVC